VIEGAPAKRTARLDQAPARPTWALDLADLSSLVRLQSP
jgi:hypothetical protein